jgi:hypothetical protein
MNLIKFQFIFKSLEGNKGDLDQWIRHDYSQRRKRLKQENLPRKSILIDNRFKIFAFFPTQRFKLRYGVKLFDVPKA